MPRRFSIEFTCTLALAGILAVLLLGQFNSFLAPLDWLCHFPALYLLAAALFTLVLVVMGRWKAVCFGFMVSLACLAVLLGPFTPGRSEATTSTNLVVAVANVTINNQRHDEIIDALPEADVIALLETGPAWTTSLDDLESEWPWQWRELRPDPFAMTVISRHRVLSSQWLTLAPGGYPLLKLLLEVDGVSVEILVAHTMSPQSLRMLELRNAQLRKLSGIIDGMDDNLVLIGDLNATNWSRVMTELELDTGLHNSRASAGPQGAFMGTWPSIIPAFLRIPIDHCLIRGDIAVVSNRIFHIPGSDHDGLVVELALSPPRENPEAPAARGSTRPHPIPFVSRYLPAHGGDTAR